MIQWLENFFSKFNLSLFSITNMRINDIIDIFLVACIIYFFLSWIRETRAWSLFKGIVILIILKQIFMLLGLYTLSWLLGSLFKVGLVAIVVLFQPEIRKVLEGLGKGNFIISNVKEYGLENKEIIKALKIMSSNKTGALIALEMDVPLGEFEKTGILIDAKITSQLLANIFEDKTPLHDGAVIIRNNRVAAAGCILPVTSQEIGKELGTRHRAAVGLSEVCDAIVLVVSEETGAISMARAGKLLRNINSDEVFDVLQKSIDITTKNKWHKFNFGGKDK